MEPTWTDKLEAVATALGTLAAIIAVLYGIAVYRRDKKETSKKMGELEKLATEQARANVISDEMILIEKRKRKLMVKPELKLAYEGIEDEIITFKIKNYGGVAKDVNILEYGQNRKDRREIRNLGKIPNGDEVNACVQRNNDDGSPFEYFGLNYKDEDNTKYELEYIFDYDTQQYEESDYKET